MSEKELEKVNGGQNVCNRVASVGNGKNFKKQAQSSIRVNISEMQCTI